MFMLSNAEFTFLSQYLMPFVQLFWTNWNSSLLFENCSLKNTFLKTSGTELHKKTHKDVLPAGKLCKPASHFWEKKRLVLSICLYHEFTPDIFCLAFSTKHMLMKLICFSSWKDTGKSCVFCKLLCLLLLTMQKEKLEFGVRLAKQ